MKKSHGYLHLASAFPSVDFYKSFASGKGHHTAVDPALKKLPKTAFDSLNKNSRGMEFVPEKAHSFLDKKIAEGCSYHTITFTMPPVTMLTSSAHFVELCKKMNEILVPGGNVVMLTEHRPDQKIQFREEGQTQIFPIENIKATLEEAGFKVKISKTTNPRVLMRSKTVMLARSISRQLGTPIKDFFLVVATKRAN